MSLEISLRHDFPGFSLDVEIAAPPGVTALFGRSGSGKTTVVSAVAGLLRPDAGRVAVDGAVLLDRQAGIHLPAHRRRVGYVFQEGRLFPHLSVRHNLAFGRWFAPRGTMREDPDRVIEMLGIGHLLDRRPGRLSGGEKQRVAIGRALLAAPRLLLMDEPLAALDSARKEEILPYLQRLGQETRVPILYVSHSIAEVARLATTVVALRDGRVLRAGPAAELLSDPETVPEFGVRAAGALLPATVRAHHPADGLTELATSGGPLYLPAIEAAPGSPLRLRIEAHDVVLATSPPAGLSALNLLPAEIETIRAGSGPGAVVALRVGEDRLLARITRRSLAELALRPGMRCHAILNATAIAPQDIGAPPRSRPE